MTYSACSYCWLLPCLSFSDDIRLMHVHFPPGLFEEQVRLRFSKCQDELAKETVSPGEPVSGISGYIVLVKALVHKIGLATDSRFL